MIIVDVESSGISAQKCSLLSVGAIDFDTPERRFYEECRIFDGAHVEKEALAVNGFSNEQINDPGKQTDRELIIKMGEKGYSALGAEFDRKTMVESVNNLYESVLAK